MTLDERVKKIEITMESTETSSREKKLLEIRKKVLQKGNKAFSKLAKL